jgi:hypothetical protein
MVNVDPYRRLVQSAILLGLFVFALHLHPRPQSRLDIMTVYVADRPVVVEIANDAVSRARGLQGRQVLADNAGMLFVFPEETTAGFWMKDTFIDLDIGFFDADGRLMEICRMRALDEVSLCHPSEPARFALEVNRGWFDANDIKPDAALRLSGAIDAR